MAVRCLSCIETGASQNRISVWSYVRRGCGCIRLYQKSTSKVREWGQGL